MEDPVRLTMTLCIIAEKAGAAIQEVAKEKESRQFEMKEDGSPLTIADLTAHNIIVSGLKKLENAAPIVSEEGLIGNPILHDYCYLVDPLDGTKEFLRGNGMYTVNIALMKKIGQSNWKPVIGVVHAPALGITWFGGEKMGSTRKDSEGIRSIIAGRNSIPPIILGSVSHATPLDRSFANSIGEHVFEGVGSSIKICRVAEGSADLAPRFGTTSCWDTAAAHAILAASGGNLISPQGIEITYDVVDKILNPWFLATSNPKWTEKWMNHQSDIRN